MARTPGAGRPLMAAAPQRLHCAAVLAFALGVAVGLLIGILIGVIVMAALAASDRG